MKIYTDGACKNNGKVNARGGMGIYFGNGDRRNLSKKLDVSLPQTNNISELTAIDLALNILVETEDIENDTFTIYSDSDYSLKCVTVWIHNWMKNGWKTAKGQPVKNKELLQRINEVSRKFKNLKFVHVAAHTGKTDEDSIGNHYADMLATNSLNEY